MIRVCKPLVRLIWRTYITSDLHPTHNLLVANEGLVPDSLLKHLKIVIIFYWWVEGGSNLYTPKNYRLDPNRNMFGFPKAGISWIFRGAQFSGAKGCFHWLPGLALPNAGNGSGAIGSGSLFLWTSWTIPEISSIYV